MERVIYLHLGLPKTGTTTIQVALHASREKMMEAGFLYPGFAVNHSMPLKAVFGNDPRIVVMNWLRGGKRMTAQELAQEWSAKLDAALAEPGWTTAVLSAEGISTLPARSLIALRERLEKVCDRVVVPLVLRHPYALRLSLIQQHLKTGDTIAADVDRLSVPGFLSGTVQRMTVAFGAENLRFMVLEEMQRHAGGLTGAFAAEIGLPAETLAEVPRTHMNKRMSQRACLVLDRLNQSVPLFVEGRTNPRRNRHVEKLIRNLPGPAFALTSAQAESLRAAVEDDMAVAERLLGRRVWKEAIPAHTGAVSRHVGIGAMETVARIVGRVLPQSGGTAR